MSENKKYTIGVLLIATNLYKQFIPQLLEGIQKYFFVNHNVQVFLFNDEYCYYEKTDRVVITQHPIPSYKFPEATLLRYKIFTSRTYNCDYLLYLDIDMKIVDYIDESILGDIIAVRHPGFDKVGGGSWETRKESTAYVYPEKRVSYWAGGVQGGETEKYYRLMQRMKRDIEEDERNGIVPIWHDESVWNFYLSEMESFKQLDSSYCQPEQEHLQKLWKIDYLPKKIIALDKNHNEIRK